MSKMRLALSLAIVLGPASGAMATTKHQKHRHPGTTIERRIPQDPYGDYGMAANSKCREGMRNLANWQLGSEVSQRRLSELGPKFLLPDGTRPNRNKDAAMLLARISRGGSLS
jgi:hypothetical protein